MVAASFSGPRNCGSYHVMSVAWASSGAVCQSEYRGATQTTLDRVHTLLATPYNPQRELAAGVAMPFYEYECPACKYYAEVLQKISDRPLKKCPSCGRAGFKRLMSAPVFRLKGSGWYETDFKSDKEGQRNLAAAEREEPKAATPEAKAASDDKGTAKPAAEAATPQAEKARSDTAAPAIAEGKPGKAEKPDSSGREAARSSRPKRAAKPARPPGKPPARRAEPRPTRAAARRSRRR